ncbi:hypothetical protein SKAU_G00148370 [Synaphobranchus kaupii]|uniref:Uncharacterized protein n=1 Tax=Synaphobranchus kaupii TaxID=118154 RepID=A0A9Q1J4P7_SYNKA|nr:hypothetical protein SKAU_G00148370 [Synaphobranchus kaupii]
MNQAGGPEKSVTCWFPPHRAAVETTAVVWEMGKSLTPALWTVARTTVTWGPGFLFGVGLRLALVPRWVPLVLVWARGPPALR